MKLFYNPETTKENKMNPRVTFEVGNKVLFFNEKSDLPILGTIVEMMTNFGGAIVRDEDFNMSAIELEYLFLYS